MPMAGGARSRPRSAGPRPSRSADRVFDSGREKLLDREGLEQSVGQLKGKLADLREEHAELKARVRGKEKESLRKDRLLSGILQDARAPEESLSEYDRRRWHDDLERAQEELSLLLQHKKHAYELRAQVEDREQTIHGIQVELRGSRSDALAAEVEALKRECKQYRDELDGSDVKFVADVTALRAQTDKMHCDATELENRLADQLGRRHQLDESCVQLEQLRDQQRKQAGELASMSKQLEKATPEAEAGPADLEELRSRESQQVAELESLQAELSRLEALDQELERPQAGVPRLACKVLKLDAGDMRDAVVAAAVRRAHHRAGQEKGVGVAALFADKDRDHDLLLTAEEVLAALQPLAVQLTRADVQLAAKNTGSLVPWVPLATLVDPDVAAAPAPREEVWQPVVDACRVRRLARHDLLSACRDKESLRQLLPGLDDGLAGSLVEWSAELPWRLPYWTLLEDQDAQLLLARFLAAERARPRTWPLAGTGGERGTLADFRQAAPDVDDDVAVALALSSDGLVPFGEIAAMAERAAASASRAQELAPPTSPGGETEFSNDFEPDTDDDP